MSAINIVIEQGKLCGRIHESDESKLTVSAENGIVRLIHLLPNLNGIPGNIHTDGKRYFIVQHADNVVCSVAIEFF